MRAPARIGKGRSGFRGLNPGFVFTIKRFAPHEGPGLRTTVFLKGCPVPPKNSGPLFMSHFEIDCSSGPGWRKRLLRRADVDRQRLSPITSAPMAVPILGQDAQKHREWLRGQRFSAEALQVLRIET